MYSPITVLCIDGTPIVYSVRVWVSIRGHLEVVDIWLVWDRGGGGIYIHPCISPSFVILLSQTVIILHLHWFCFICQNVFRLPIITLYFITYYGDVGSYLVVIFGGAGAGQVAWDMSGIVGIYWFSEWIQVRFWWSFDNITDFKIQWNHKMLTFNCMSPITSIWSHNNMNSVPFFPSLQHRRDESLQPVESI